MLISTSLIWLVVVAGVSYLLVRLKRNLMIAIHVHKLPGPTRYNLLLGNLAYVQDTPENIFKTARKWGLAHYPHYKVWLGYLTGACFFNPEDYELVLSNVKHIDKGPTYDMLFKWLRTGLLTSKGDKWQLRRKILTPAFHFSILQDFIAVFNEETDNLVEILKDECRKGDTNVVPVISQFALKTIGETSMGTKFDFTTKREIKYKDALHTIGKLYVHKLFRPYYYYNALFKFVYMFTPSYLQETRLVKTLHEFTDSVITKREREFKGVSAMSGDDLMYYKRRRMAMLDLMLTVKNENGLIDNEGIREEVDTFMFEGHDTTSVAICFALMLIACHKDAQDLIVQEMKEVLGDIKRKPTYNDLQELKYMERCIKETLRLYPSVHYISRKLGEDMVTSTGYRLLEGTIVHLHIYDLHHSPHIYPDPEKFDPDRFLPENCQKRHPFAFVPFSAGPRNCIGQRFALLELKAVLCGILANFVLEPVDTPATIVPVVDIVLRTQNGIKMKFVPRI